MNGVKNIFGTLEAEHDKNLLEAFVKLDKYTLLLDSENLFIVGEKGGGRSAFLKHLKEKYTEKFLLEVEIYGDDIEYDELSRQFIIDDKIAGVVSRKNLYYFWQYTIYTAMMINLREVKEFSSYEEERIKIIEKYLNNINIDENSSVSGFMLNIVSDFERQLWKNKANIDKSIISEVKNYVLKNRTYKSAVLALDEIVKFNHNSFMILFDKIDRWFGHYYDEDSNKRETNVLYDILEQLLYCVHDIGHKYEEKAYIKVFLPKDKYVPISSRDRIKLDEHKVDLYWKTDELKEFVTRRIALFEGHILNEYKSSDFQIYWHKFFPEKISMNGFSISEDSFNYILRHTFYRPRDIQLICNTIINNMKGNRATVREVIKYTHQICDNMANRYFLDEYKASYWYIANLINVFKGTDISNVYRYDEFYEKIKKLCNYSDIDVQHVPRIMNELYLMNFVGTVSISDDEPRYTGLKRRYKNKWYSCSFFFNCPTHSIEPTSDNEWIVLHPVFTDGFRINHNKEVPIL